MSVRDFVDFVHDQWGEPTRLPSNAPPNVTESDTLDGAEDGEGLPRARRPEVPDWLRDDEAGTEFDSADELEILDDADEDAPAEWKPPNGSNADTDAIAYYLPFHLYGKDRWGIYIRGQGIGWLAKQLIPGGMKQRPSLQERVTAARQFLWEHEGFHAQVEFAATRLEVLTHDSKSMKAKPVYVPYFGTGGLSIRAAREEAIANARAIKRASPGPKSAIGVGLREICSKQSVGYRHFKLYDNVGGLKRGYRQCAASLCRAIGPLPYSPGWPGEFLVDDAAPPPKEIPTRLVGSLPGWIRLVRRFARWRGIQVDMHVGREHGLPHVHATFDKGGDQWVVSWPDLKPIKAKKSMSRSQRDLLQEYVAHFRLAFEQRAAITFDTHGMPRS
jgi:hypothetical protein